MHGRGTVEKDCPHLFDKLAKQEIEAQLSGIIFVVWGHYGVPGTFE